MKLFIYDLETMFNFFSFTGKYYGDDKVYQFEMSSRKNQRTELLSFLSFLQNQDAYMVGYNNIGFDYPIIHELLTNPHTFDFNRAYQLCQQIINSQSYGGGGGFNTIHHKDRIIKQIDLVKINHFDNKNKRTRLKDLQFAMRSPSLEDMPVDFSKPLTSEQMDRALSYNAHDVTETEKFLGICMNLVELRKELLDQGILQGDVLNYSDVKIGAEYLVKRIGRNICYSGSKPKQTFRPFIQVKDIILPKINFINEHFEEVADWFKALTIKKDDESTPHLEKKLAGLDFHFGVGGVHASVETKKYESNSAYIIKDIDVSGMYVAVGISNRFYPEHLGQSFVAAYESLQGERKQHKKGTTMNKVLKLAGNGAFGNSDNPYSCFYDPRYPKQVTINGQLQILQLVEKLWMIPGLEIIQANTDGITAYVPRKLEYLFNIWCKEWEQETKLTLEHVDYDRMWIRDVNNYIAIDTKGKIKRKGAYWYPETLEDYEGYWNKDYSNMVVQKLASKMLIDGWNPEAMIYAFTDPYDFMARYKVPSGASLYIDGVEQSKTMRYYVSKAGGRGVKIANPKGEIGTYKRKSGLSDKDYEAILKQVTPGTWDERIHTKNKSKYELVETEIESGRLIKNCNKASDFNWSDVDFDYYIKEVEKLYIGEKNV